MITNASEGTFVRRKLTAALGALLATQIAGAAWAFDGLLAMAERLPVSSSNTAELYFMSPAMVAGWQPSEIPGIGVPSLAAVLFDAELGVEKVGFAFPDLEGIANFGAAPNATLHLQGSAIRPAAVGEALLRRPGMEQSDRLGVPVFAEGEDNATDVTARDPDYPFGEGWRSHRVAVWEGGAIVAYNWADLESALVDAGFGDDSGSARQSGWRLADLVEAAFAAAPPDAEAYAAAGLPPAAFEPGDGGETGDGAVVPAFEYALYVASTSNNSEAVQMVLAFRERPAASSGVRALKARLFAEIGNHYPNGTTVIGRTVDLPDDGTLAVVTVTYPAGIDGHPSSAEFQRWINDVFSRRLDVLIIASS